MANTNSTSKFLFSDWEDIYNSDVDVNLGVREWLSGKGSGVVLKFKNDGDEIINDWQVEFQSNSAIRRIFNAEIISETFNNGNYNYIVGFSDNLDLDSRERDRFSFTVRDLSPQITNIRIKDSLLEPEPKVELDVDIRTDVWGSNSGATVHLDLINGGDTAIEDWQIKFQADFQMRMRDTDIWNAEIISETPNKDGFEYIIGFPTNKVLESGEKQYFGFNTSHTTPEFEYIALNDGSEPTPLPKPQPQPQPVPEVEPEPTPISGNAIAVGFEKHSDNTRYNSSAQRRDWNVLWTTDGTMNRFSEITDEISYSGNKSLKVTYPTYETANKGAAWGIPAQKEYYLSYRLRFDQNFDFDGSENSGGKLPGLGGAGGLCSGGQNCDGNNGFTSRYMWRENGKAVLYLYHMDKDRYGDDVLLKGGDGRDKYFERGKWHNMIQRVKINDGYQSNGEIDVWMDNEKVLDMDGLRLVTNNRGIDQLFFNTFHGGGSSGWWPEREVSAYFDDFVVSTNPADVGL